MGGTTDSKDVSPASCRVDTISSLFEDYRKKIKSSTSYAETSIICFSLGNRVFGLDVAYIHNILSRQHLIPVPVSPSYILGAFGYGGRAVAMVDLQKFLQIDNTLDVSSFHLVADSVRVLVLRFSDMTMAFHVDRIHGFLRTPIDTQDTFDFSNEGRISDFLKSELIIGRIVVLIIDTEALFRGAKL